MKELMEILRKEGGTPESIRSSVLTQPTEVYSRGSLLNAILNKHQKMQI